MSRLVYLFDSYGDVTEIAKSDGREEQYFEISEKINKLIGKIRFLRKIEGSDFEGVREGKYIDSNTYATNPGNLTISDEKWLQIIESLNLDYFKRLSFNRRRKKIQEYVRFGDTNPAIVISSNPLIVAAYSGDMDAVVLLAFPEQFRQRHVFNKYDRLITVNVYNKHPIYGIKHDIFVGKNFSRA